MSFTYYIKEVMYKYSSNSYCKYYIYCVCINYINYIQPKRECTNILANLFVLILIPRHVYSNE